MPNNHLHQNHSREEKVEGRPDLSKMLKITRTRKGHWFFMYILDKAGKLYEELRNLIRKKITDCLLLKR